MGALFLIFVAVTVLLAIDVLAVRFGVDSRTESRDPRRSAYPVGIS
jgi:hypothetical protein